jgi:hypothetical protein
VAFAIVGALLVGAAAGFVGGYAAIQLTPDQEQEAGAGRGDSAAPSTDDVVAVAASTALPSVVNIDIMSGQSTEEGLPR